MIVIVVVVGTIYVVVRVIGIGVEITIAIGSIVEMGVGMMMRMNALIKRGKSNAKVSFVEMFPNNIASRDEIPVFANLLGHF